MSKPSDVPLSILPKTMEEVTKHCIIEKPDEACGFVVGRNGVGERIIRIENVYPYISATNNAESNYLMSNDDILVTMKEIDETGEDIIAVYHSHPSTEPIPSETDKQVHDTDPAYLIVSLMDGQPRARAWRIDTEFIGSPRATEVLLYLSEHGHAFADEQVSTVPWVLTVGNRVEIAYTRPATSQRRVVRATVTGHDMVDDQISVLLRGEDAMDPKSILLNRVQSIRLIKESAEARRLRARLQSLSRWAAAQMGEGKFSGVGKVVDALSSAFPVNLTHIDNKEEE